MNSKYLFAAVLISFICLTSADLSAYKISKTGGGVEIRWATSSISYLINTSGGPAGSLSVIQSALQVWTDVSTSNFSFVYGGTTASTAYGDDDGTNLILFGPLNESRYEYTLGLNTFWFNPLNGELADSDIIFNTNYTWGTDGSSGAYDVQNIGTHELGHSLSLDDLYDGADSEITMYGLGSSGETKKRTLHQDDMDGIIYLYPGPTACISHDSVGCYAGHVYWYDSCGVRAEKKETCGCTSTVEAVPYCQSGNIYEDSCDYVCSSGQCYSSAGSQKTEDCGVTEYTTDYYCCGDDVCKDKIVRGCEEVTAASCYENDEAAEIVRTCDEGCLDGKCLVCELDSMWPATLNTVFWFFGTFCFNDFLPAIVPVYIESSDEHFDNTEDVFIEHTGTTVLWQNPIGDDTVMAILLVRGGCYSYNFDVYVGDCLGEDMFVLNE